MHDKLTNSRIHLNCLNLTAGGEAQTWHSELPKHQKMKVTSTKGIGKKNPSYRSYLTVHIKRDTDVLQNTNKFLFQQVVRPPSTSPYSTYTRWHEIVSRLTEGKDKGTP
jgi:hypothetical protein